MKWKSKFQIKPGKWVFQPSDESLILGRAIKAAVEKIWNPPPFYYHLQVGGHVAGLRAHTGNTCFLHLDIQDFFGNVNRSRVTRCLKQSLGYAEARRYANESTVQHPEEKGRFILPFGFVQSPILASLALDQSALGECIQRVSEMDGVEVSVYVDDIVVSSKIMEVLDEIRADLHLKSIRSNFPLNSGKEQGPAKRITAFNIELSEDSLLIQEERFEEFKTVVATTTNSRKKEGVKSYVKSVNLAQFSELDDDGS